MSMWVLALLGCRSGDNDHTHPSLASPGTGTTGVNDPLEPDAPWTVGPIESALFAFSPDSTGRSGEGLLVLSTEDVRCQKLTSINSYDDVFPELEKGTSFVFALDYYDGPRGRQPDWTGLWFGYSYDLIEETERSMQSIAIHDGIAYALGYYSATSWVVIDQHSGNELSGAFSALYWDGTFEAADCGPWEEDPTDSYSYYDSAL